MVSWSLLYLTFVISVIDFYFTANVDISIFISIYNPINVNEIDANSMFSFLILKMERSTKNSIGETSVKGWYYIEEIII